MSTSTLAPEARRNSHLFMTGDLTATKPKMFSRFKKDDSGAEVEVLVIEDLPVFRSGTFRDSMGYQHLWETEHLNQMVDNFDVLRSRGVFADVPIRDGHPGFLVAGIEGNGKVVGWHTKVRTEERTNPADGANYTYLLSNVEIIAPYAIEAIKSGLWRNRSAEVGSYITNAEAEYWPVFQGFAYCDIPAVEGLNGFSKPGIGSLFSLMTENEKEIPVAMVQTKPFSQEANGTQEAPFEAPATPEADEGTQPNEGDENSDEGEENEAPAAEAAAEPQPTGSQAVESGEGQHSRSGAGFMFTVNGQQTSDFAAVQAHITSLEGGVTQRREQFRKDYVTTLANDGKILAPQISQVEGFALTLNDEQWTQFMATWDAAPGSSVTANHTSGTSNHDGTVSNEDQEVENLRAIIQHHKAGGMSQENLEKTESYKRLQLLTNKEN